MSFFTPLGEGGKLARQSLPRSYYARRWPKRLAAVAVGVVVLAGALVGLWRLTGLGDARDGHADAYSCPAPRPASLRPPAVTSVKVNVYNATPESGLAAVVADELAKRGFTVVSVGNDPLAQYVSEPFEIRAGPQGARQRDVVAAHAPGAVVKTDEKRKDAMVDLVIGDGFTRLAEVDQAQTALSGPQAPAGIYCPGLETPSPATVTS